MMKTISEAAAIAKAVKYNNTFKTIKWEEFCFQDGHLLSNEECIDSGIVGSTVDYLSRMMLLGDKNKAFASPLSFTKFSVLANSSMSGTAGEFLQKITGLDGESIINACYLACFDSYSRKRDLESLLKSLTYILNLQPRDYKPTVENIRVMVQRCIEYFKGSVLDTGFYVSYGHLFGDGDFLSETELCDLKTGKGKPSLKNKRQVLLYWYAGLNTEGLDFSKVDTLSIFNPRLNTAWKLKVSQIPEDMLDEVDMFCWECL